MIVWLIVAACCGLYLGAGIRIARWDIPASWERARIEWSIERHQRESARASFLMMVLFWPIRLLIRAITRAADREIDAGDPKAIQERMRQQERDIAERDRRIRELERELGIEQDVRGLES